MIPNESVKEFAKYQENMMPEPALMPVTGSWDNSHPGIFFMSGDDDDMEGDTDDEDNFDDMDDDFEDDDEFEEDEFDEDEDDFDEEEDDFDYEDDADYDDFEEN